MRFEKSVVALLGAAWASGAMAGQAGPILPMPIIEQDEAALTDLSYFSAAAIGELTGDDVADVLVLRRGPGGEGEGQLSVFRGDGVGGLTLVSRLAIAGDPTSVLLADVAGDGRVEALVTDGGASAVFVYAQRGAGRFELVETIATGRTPVEVALTDVTGDGVADLLVCNYDHYFVGLHAGLPGGGFGPIQRLNVGLRPADMAVIDADDDGDLDVLTADELSGTVSLLVNDGGVFAPAVVAVEMPDATSLSMTDLDGDGLPELVVAGAEGVRLFRNDGGSFVPAPASFVSTASNFRHVLLRDVDADGHADLVLSRSNGAEVYAGVADGLAETAEPVLLGGSFAPRSGGLFAGDLTGGASLDLVLVEPSRVSVALAAEGVPAGAVGLWTPITLDRERALGQVVGQFTDDELPDVLIADDTSSRLLVGLGDGAYAEPSRVRGLPTQGLIAARLRPGNLDDVLILGSTLRMTRPDGTGLFGIPVGVSALGRDVAVADLDGDGDLDLAAGGPNTAEPLINDGMGDFTPGATLEFPGFLASIAIGEVTGDGVADILVGSGSELLYIWPGLGGGEFAERQDVATGYRNDATIWPIDVGDSADALLVRGGSSNLQLMRGLDTPSPIRTPLVESIARIEGVQVLDVNGDGREDFALFGSPRQGASIWLQRDGAAFERAAGFALWAYLVQLVEATGDGVLDALIGFGNRTYLAIGKPGQLVACPADLDGDGELTLFDFLAFQTLFDAGDPAADFDGDGILTVFDFLQFQNLFDLGCP